jgi:hypothetical protein
MSTLSTVEPQESNETMRNRSLASFIGREIFPRLQEPHRLRFADYLKFDFTAPIPANPPGRMREEEIIMPLARLDEDLKRLREMQEGLSAMPERVKTTSALRANDELNHVTRELIKSLGAEIQVLEKTTAGMEKPNIEQ